MKATEETQISVFLSNHPGVVADLCSALARADVNIRALTVLDTVDIGTMRMVVSDPERAKNALTDIAAAYVLIPVISLALPSRTGSFGEVARIMANAGVNIEYVYSSTLPDADRALGIFRVSDVDTARKLDYPECTNLAKERNIGQRELSLAWGSLSPELVARMQTNLAQDFNEFATICEDIGLLSDNFTKWVSTSLS